MDRSLAVSTSFLPSASGSFVIVPDVVAVAGDRAATRFVEFFTATIRNPNTRLAYGRAVGTFLSWCEDQGLGFDRIGPVMIASYVEQLLANGMAKPRSSSTWQPSA